MRLRLFAIGFKARPGLWLALLLPATPAAMAQYAVGQDGRLFDANPSLTYGPRNYSRRPVSPLIAGNALATGNVGRGLALRSFSPIGSTTSFRAPLGSGSLSVFRRDSVSVADRVTPGGGLLPRAYYDPSLTAPTGGFLSGQYDVATIPSPFTPQRDSAAQSPGDLLDTRLDARMRLRPLETSLLGMAPDDDAQLSSGLFGLSPPALRSPAQTLESQLSFSRESVGRSPLEGDLPTRFEGVPEIPGSQPPLGTPLDYVLGNDPTPLLTEELMGPARPLGEAPQPGWAPLPGVPNVGVFESETAAGPIGLRDPSMLPGFDVFNDMQMALALAQTSDTTWFGEMQAAIRQHPAMAEELQEFADVPPDEFVERLMTAPLGSFVGRGRNAVNNELLRAESLLDMGQFYDAAARYEQAHMLDPANPLPSIGKGHALLAAGDYLSAALAIAQGLEQFPDLARFRVDLKALIGGGEIVDIRRADIMRLLKDNDDARLWFLLGYLEYHGGYAESGMANLRKAAEKDRGIESIISRYAQMLEQRGGQARPPAGDASRLPENPPADPPPPPREEP